VINRERRPALFQVEDKRFSYNSQQGTIFKLESEPVGGGEPWRIEGPAGTTVHRITQKR
jgi:hypothetical protein